MIQYSNRIHVGSYQLVSEPWFAHLPYPEIYQSPPPTTGSYHHYVPNFDPYSLPYPQQYFDDIKIEITVLLQQAQQVAPTNSSMQNCIKSLAAAASCPDSNQISSSTIQDYDLKTILQPSGRDSLEPPDPKLLSDEEISYPAHTNATNGSRIEVKDISALLFSSQTSSLDVPDQHLGEFYIDAQLKVLDASILQTSMKYFDAFKMFVKIFKPFGFYDPYSIECKLNMGESNFFIFDPGGIIICTDGIFWPDRIIPIAERFGMDHNTILDYEHQYNMMLGLAAKMSEEPFGLMIVDSIIALFRVDIFGRGELPDRQQKFAQMLSRLMKISEEFNVAVYMTNHVITDPRGLLYKLKQRGNTASDAALVILLSYKFSQLLDALTLAQTTMSKANPITERQELFALHLGPSTLGTRSLYRGREC